MRRAAGVVAGHAWRSETRLARAPAGLRRAFDRLEHPGQRGRVVAGAGHDQHADQIGLLLVDLFEFSAAAREKVTVRLAANPAASSTAGKAVLTLAGPGLLRVDNTALPNVVSATAAYTARHFVTVSETLLSRGRFQGAYCVTLDSTANAWQTLAAR
jgi:hypothetical protein